MAFECCVCARSCHGDGKEYERYDGSTATVCFACQRKLDWFCDQMAVNKLIRDARREEPKP